MAEPKYLITQDVKALIQSVGPNRCNIFVIQNNNTQVGDGTTFWEIFKALPEPRWRSLKMLLSQELAKNIPVNNQRAMFAGLSIRTLRGWKDELNMERKNIPAQITETICDNLM